MDFSNVWRKHLDFKRITPHGSQRIHCSLLFKADSTIKKVQERLGHKNIQTTIDIYAMSLKKQRMKLLISSLPTLVFKIWVSRWVSKQKKGLPKSRKAYC
ncbi:TPA: tyrosine-type recombinase/integrase [Streptococcus suis]